MNGITDRADRLPPLPLIGGLLGAAILSATLIWLVGGSTLVAAAYVGGLLTLTLALLLASRLRAAPEDEGLGQPDWSVTHAAIENRRRAIAITDRANRVTCANTCYEEWFGGGAAPMELGFDTADREKLAAAAKAAWRDGEGTAESLAFNATGKPYSLQVHRSGRGEDYLVWRFSEIVVANSYDGVAERISGPFGYMMSRAGIEVALVASDGVVMAHTPGLAMRATGNPEADLKGSEFVQLLRTDDRDRIFFAREGQQGTPQTLVQISLEADRKARGAGSDPASAVPAPSTMVLIDGQVGIGNRADASRTAAVPQLEALLAALPLGLALTDRDGRFLFANKAFLRAIEREQEGLPQYPSDLVVREDKGPLSDTVRRFARGSAASGDMAVRLAGDKEEPISLGLAGVRGLGDAAVLLSLSDSTEEKRLRRQVAQATKMQAVGQLAGGVAHDFNNVLTAIIGYCDLMLLRHTPGDSDYDDIQQIKANSNRAASLTRQLLAFSRQQTLRPVVLQLPDVVSEVSQLLKRLMGDRIEYSIRHDRELGPVRADPQQLEQVIINLAVNARDAMHAYGQNAPADWKGRLTLATRRVSARDVINKIFEPFFTTKEQGKGTGLGLSTVYGIVKQSNGFIFADNVQGPDGNPAGARFTMYLPVHRGEMPRATKPRRAESEKASEWSAGGKLLLVEDEDTVRAVAERALTRAGYAVTTASDGEIGLGIVANSGETFDLVVSDVVMPVMDGPAMARAIRRVMPDVPILFMSGYAEEHLRNEIDIENMHFIPKPFSVQQINAKVAEVLSLQKSARETA